MKIQQYLSVLFFCVIVCALAGCGAKEPVSPAGAPGKDVEVLMWLIGSEAQAMTINDLAEEFYAQTKIRVRCEAISWGDGHSKYLTSIAGGVAPDIGAMGLTWGSEFGSLGAMVDLKAAHPAEIVEMQRAVFPGLWNSIECGGRVYGIPFDMTEYVLYYRNDIVTTPPKTWDELTILLGTLKAQGKGMLFDWGSMSWIGYSPFLWQAGGDFFSPDLTKVTLDSPEASKALMFFADLYLKFGVPKTKIPLEQGIRTGDFPIAISGNWKIDELRLSAPEIAGKWSIATLPKGPAGKMTGFIGGRIIGIFSQSKRQNEAWQFMKFLFTSAAQSKLYEAGLSKQDTYLPPSIKTWDALKMDPELKSVLFAQANDSKGPPAVANWDAHTKGVDEAIQKVILQDGDPVKELELSKGRLERERNCPISPTRRL